ncbi:prepilin-type N-terminal cleavage/methylation domain-containing protein [Kamptonema cortianum]|nr:prepilin-type N-terminal cleavage/methylation domain-containing protein [Kamptonema cortianum]MDL5049722.1 prepilin-type N-terminal cleavage/methylation domain-containing protein [Oscillatoria amoena NRMC-F 0135]
MKDCGVTLLELIFCLVVLSILAVVGLSLGGKIKTKYEILGSINNLKTAYVGIVSYAGDHDGKIPENRGVLDDDLEDGNYTMETEILPGMLDLPYVLLDYVPERTFLSPGNKRHKDEGYYVQGVATSYWYKGMGQRLDGKTPDGHDFPLSEQVLLSEIRGYYDGKSCRLTADGRVLTDTQYP